MNKEWQCWVIVNWIPRNKLQWNFDQNTKLLIHENACENIVYEMAPCCPEGNELSEGHVIMVFHSTLRPHWQIQTMPPRPYYGDKELLIVTETRQTCLLSFSTVPADIICRHSDDQQWTPASQRGGLRCSKICRLNEIPRLLTSLFPLMTSVDWLQYETYSAWCKTLATDGLWNVGWWWLSTFWCQGICKYQFDIQCAISWLFIDISSMPYVTGIM